MKAKKELYEYVAKRKQRIIDQYDKTLKQIQCSNGFESLISFLGDRETLISIYGRTYEHDTKEILRLFTLIIDEMYQDHKLFQGTEKEITHGCVIYSKDNYSIEFHNPVNWEKITIRYHGIIKPLIDTEERIKYLHRLYQVKEQLEKIIEKKNLLGYVQLAKLMYSEKHQTNNPWTLFNRCRKLRKSVKNGLLDKTIKAIEMEEERKKIAEEDMELFYEQQEEAKQIKEEADQELAIFRKLGWKIEYEGILVNNQICW